MSLLRENFSLLPIGTKVGKNTIERCPHCEKAGLKESDKENVWYVHSQWRGYNEEGLPIVGWDSCPRPDYAVKKSPAKN